MTVARSGCRSAMSALALGLTMTAFVGGAVGQTAAAPAHVHKHGAMQASTVSGFQKDMDSGMARMMQGMHSPGYSGNVDVDFLSMMIPHHAGAVDMARLALKHGRDPATRQLAEEIIAGQTIEIESMTRRLAMLRQAQSTANSVTEYPALGGTRGD
jgi:uncharacterized protein (DUF305 family)